MNWTEERIAWLFLLNWAFAFSTTMICFDLDFTDALLNATATRV
jgi:hypothetical protein